MQKNAYLHRTGLCGYLCITQLLPGAFPQKRNSHDSGKKMIVRAMKLTITLLTVSFLSVYASGSAQRVTLSGNKLSLKEVFAAIQVQTGYDVFYSENIVKVSKPITVSANDLVLEKFLEIALFGQPFTYKIAGKTILLSLKETSTPAEGLKSLTPFWEAFLPITGVIKGKDGQPLVGATIRVKGENISAATNEQGNFEINAEAGSVLIISYIGFKVKEVKVTDASFLSISLVQQETKLDTAEVIVSSGYQQLPRERATGAFEQVGNKALNLQTGSDILGRLEGTSTILFDKNASRPALTIRGLSSLNGNKDPLIVVDNFPYEGNIANINPNDVESVTILKDAAAASIWGVRAGNGVIVITTKKGRLNQPLSLELNTNVTITNKPDLGYAQQMSSSDYIDVEQFLYAKGYYTSAINNTSTRPALSPVVELLVKKANGQLPAADADAQINALRTVDARKDFDRYLYQQAVNQQYALNLRGGTDKIAYSLSGGLDRNKDVLKAGYKRYSVRSENVYQPVQELQLTAALAYTQSENVSGAPSYGSFNTLYPYAQLADANSNALPIARYRKGYTDTAGNGKLLDWGYYPSEDYRHTATTSDLQHILARLGIRYQLNKQVSVSVDYQYENQQSVTEQLQDMQSFYTRDIINRYSQVSGGTIKYIVPKGAILDRSTTGTISNNIRAQLNYNRGWGQHKLSAIAGAEMRSIHTKGNSYRLYGYYPDILTIANVDYVNAYPDYVTKAYGFIDSKLAFIDRLNRYVSTYANVAYAYKGRYTVSGSMRRDASNAFGVNTNNRWKPLWSIGGAWDIARENFYRIGWMPFLKLKATYGYSGNILPGVSGLTTLSMRSAAPSTNLPYAVVGEKGNPDLRWEQVVMLNIGLDFATKGQAFSGSLAWFHKKGTDLYGYSPIDYTTGAGNSLFINVADIKGQGLDLELNAKIIDREFKWSTGSLFSYNLIKVSKYYLTSNNGANYVKKENSISPLVGNPAYSILSFRFAGLDNMGNPQGIVKGNRSIDYAALLGTGTTVNDLVYSGSATPTVYGSWANTFSWKAISMTVNINYKAGYYFRRKSIDYGQLLLGVEKSADYSKRWQHAGDEQLTDVPSFVYPNNTNRDAFYSASDVLIEKADHIRLQFIRLSYQLDKKAVQHLPLQSIQLYLNAGDLGILWRANKSGTDPDYPNTFTSTPPAISIAAGIRAVF